MAKDHGPAFDLVLAVKALYKTWNLEHCHGQFLQNTGLKEEPFFRYFSYPDFMTPFSGLIQIRKYAEIQNLPGLLEPIGLINRLTRNVRDELYRVLMDEAKYFG